MSSSVEDFKVKSEVRLDRPQPWEKLNDGYSGGSIICQVFFWFLFWGLGVVLSLVLMIKTYADVNTSGEFNMYTYTCDSGYQYVWYGHDMDAGLHTQYCDCRVANNLRRALNSTPQHYTMFDLLAEYIYIPITGCMMVLVLSGIWLAAMKRFGQTFIWLSLILIFSIMIAMAVLLFSYEATDAAVVILVLAGLLLAYLAFRREMINRAGKTLETAAKGLWKNVSVFIILGPIECVFIGYIFLWMNAWTMSFKTYEVNSVTCEIDLSGSSYRDMWIVSFLMLWVSFYINHVKVNVVGATLAAWAFGQKNEYSWDVPKQAIRWSFWESSPTLALTSLICTIIERIKRTIENKCNWVNPACCLIMCIGSCLLSTIQAFGRFAVVLHSITGKPFYESVYHSFRLLIKGGNIEHAISADYFVSLSLNLTAYFLSVGIGIVLWVWIDDESGMKTFDPKQEDWEIYFWILFIGMVIGLKYPYWSVFFIALLGGNQGFANTTSGRSSIVLLGWFGGAVAHIIFGFFAAIVLDAVDTMVMCYAIDKDNGFSQADYSKKDPVVATLYASFDNLVKEHGDLSNVQDRTAMATTSIATASSVPIESQKVRVTIPQGVMAGQKLKATAPDGMVFEIIVPEGCVPGQVLEVDRSTA